jgi:hypothetical protein
VVRLATYQPVLCLPKSGSTSLTQWLEDRGQPARHEWNTLAVLHLAGLRHRPDFGERRRLWLQARARELAGDWDVNTALYAVLLPGADVLETVVGFAPQWLCRSPRPWLQSGVAWSLRYAGDPYRSHWLKLHRGFVEACSPLLAAAMPVDPASPELLLRFWLPVWIAFQQQAIEHALACGRPYLLTDQLPAQHHANPSSLPAAWRQRLERLVPPLPELRGDPVGDRSCLEVCRGWLDQLASSRG